jgi:UDP-4-amino-4,6-dideoxy-N-acetyl-beta-L-altrosamine N-acetyltransferase
MFRLRPIEAADCDRVLEWRNDPRVRVNMYTHHEIMPDEHRKWFEAARSDASRRLLMCEDEQGAPLGVVIFSEINPTHGTATWAFYSGSNARRGVGSEMELLALDYAFGELGLEKLNCEVLSFNMPVVEFHRKHGFRIEGIFRSQYVRDGVRHDIYRLAHFRNAWMKRARPFLVRQREGAVSRFRIGSVHRESLTLGRDQLRQYAEVSGDANPVHLDDGAARAAGFEGVLAHGMLVAAGFSRILGTKFPGPGTIYAAQSLQFLLPVHPDIELEYELKIVSRIGERAFLSTQVKAGEKTLVTGEAEVILPTEEAT